MDDISGDTRREHRFRPLYEDLYPDLLRFVQRRTDDGTAEDVVAEVFLTVWRRLEDVPGSHDGARAWVFGIARNLLLNTHRSNRRRSALGVRLADAERIRAINPADVNTALQIDLERAWRELSEAHQETLALTVFEGLNSTEAATVVGVSATAFRLRLSRARKALRCALETDRVLATTERI